MLTTAELRERRKAAQYAHRMALARAYAAEGAVKALDQLIEDSVKDDDIAQPKRQET